MNAPAPRRPVDASAARIVALAAPMMLAHLTEPLIGLVDTAVIGRLGEVHLLGAVAIGAVLFDMLFWGLGSLRMSTAGLTAQAFGAGDDREVARALARALAVAACLGVLLILLQAPIIAATFRLMDASPAVTEAARDYIRIRIWSGPFALANYAILGSLIVYAAEALSAGWSNTGLWIAFLLFLAIRGLGQAALYPRLARRSFAA
ncbi:MATE family efflux transporter [Alsobacter sp. SYSU BS001988]